MSWSSTHCLVATVRSEPDSLEAGLLDLEALGVRVREVESPVGGTQWVLVEATEEPQLCRAEEALRHRFGSERLVVCHDPALALHVGGKLRVEATVAIDSAEALALVDTPAAGRVSWHLAEHPDAVRHFTGKGSTVAVVTDGSAVAGLGDLRPEAALPVLEGKAVLLRQLADLNAVPICLNTRDARSIVQTLAAIAPSFGCFDLVGISAPRCFAIEGALRERVDIPVLHDDQHATAVVVLAALVNALRVVGKGLPAARVVVAGAGAAGTAVVKQLLGAGVSDVVVCVSSGVLHRPAARDLPPHQAWLATHTNPRQVTGGLPEALVGADVFIGLSHPGVVSPEALATMDPDPIVFLLADPVPEVDPAEIVHLAAVIATARPDYPNHVSNALAFPGLFRGVLDARAQKFSPSMLLAAAETLAGLVGPSLGPKRLLPDVLDPDVVPAVASAVVKRAGASLEPSWRPRRRAREEESS